MRYELPGMYTSMAVYVHFTVLSNSQTNPYNFGFKGKKDLVCLGILCCKEELPRGQWKRSRAHDVSYEPWDEDNSLRYDSTDGSSVI